MLAVHGFYENGQVRFNHIPPIKKGVMRVIVTFLEEEQDNLLTSDEYLNYVTRLDGFSHLKPNWDSYNADAITPQSIASAKEVLAYLYQTNIPIDGVFPMRNGGVQIEFSKEKAEIELEILAENVNCLTYENTH